MFHRFRRRPHPPFSYVGQDAPWSASHLSSIALATEEARQRPTKPIRVHPCSSAVVVLTFGTYSRLFVVPFVTFLYCANRFGRHAYVILRIPFGLPSRYQ